MADPVVLVGKKPVVAADPTAGMGLALDANGKIPTRILTGQVPYSQLTLANSIVNADINTAAAIGISKLADPTTGKVVGSSGSAAAAVFPPGYTFAYNEFTAAVTVSATTEGTANTVVTASAVTFDGSTIAKIEFFAPSVTLGTTSGDQVIFLLYLDGASIGIIGQMNLNPAGGAIFPAPLARRLTPASGSRTYSIRAYKVGTGNGTVTAGVGGTPAVYLPGYIRITKE
jgi:hypothetical protein